MISANECKKNTAEKEAETAEHEKMRKEQIRENTLDFCNTTVSERLDAASKAGLHSITLNFFKSNLYDSYHLIHKVNSYWSIESYEWRDIDTIKEVAKMHGYNVEVRIATYKKNSTKWESGKAVVISW